MNGYMYMEKVEPKTGKTLWYLIPRLNNKWLSLVDEAFAKDVGFTSAKIVLLVEDNAGWHRTQKAVEGWLRNLAISNRPTERSESGAVRQDGMARSPEECRAAPKCAISNRPRHSKSQKE